MKSCAIIVLSFAIASGGYAAPSRDDAKRPSRAVHSSAKKPRMPSFTEPEMERQNPGNRKAKKKIKKPRAKQDRG